MLFVAVLGFSLDKLRVTHVLNYNDKEIVYVHEINSALFSGGSLKTSVELPHITSILLY